MKIINAIFATAAWVVVVSLAGCSQSTTAEKLSGVWTSIEITGTDKLTKDNVEMQLDIRKSGDVNVIVVNNKSGRQAIERSSAKIEGEYIIFSENEIGKIFFDGHEIKITDGKRGTAIIFNKSKF